MNGIAHTAELYLYFTKVEVKNIEKIFATMIVSNSPKTLTIDFGDVTITIVKEIGLSFMKIDFIKLLRKPMILESDLALVNMKINDYITSMTIHEKDLVLKRFDFRLDALLPEKDHEFLFQLYEKALSKFRALSRIEKYIDSLYYKTKSQNHSMALNIYSKPLERAKKGEEIMAYEKDVIRYEVQLRNRHLNYQKSKGRDKSIEAYLDQEIFLSYILRFIKSICYFSDFHDINNARKLIQRSVNSKKEQEKLLKFLITASRGSLDTVRNKYSNYQYKIILGKLESLNINPILIPRNLGIPYFRNPLSDFYSFYPFK